MIRNVKKFLRDNEKKRLKFLRGLSIKRAADILGSMISSSLLRAFTSKPKSFPLSLEKSLKHAKFAR